MSEFLFATNTWWIMLFGCAFKPKRARGVHSGEDEPASGFQDRARPQKRKLTRNRKRLAGKQKMMRKWFG